MYKFSLDVAQGETIYQDRLSKFDESLLLYHKVAVTNEENVAFVPETSKYEQFENLYKETINKAFDKLDIDEINYLKLIKRFYKAIEDGPCYVCACCDQMHFKKRLSLALIENIDMDWLDICFYDETDTSIFLCLKCKKFLQNGLIPPLAKVHGFQFPEVPEVLESLNLMEERILSPRITFMMIKQLGVGRQYGITGGCINVPVDINNTVSQLPRKLDDTYTIHLQLKRRLSDKNAFEKSVVRPKKIYDAAKFLVQTPVYQKHVTLCEDWLNDLEEEVDVVTNCASIEEGELEKIDEINDIEETEVNAQPTLMTTNFLPDYGKNDDPSTDQGLSIAPGEGKSPLSLLFDEDAEELACPKTYVGQKIVINSGVRTAERNKALMRLKGRRICKNIHAKMMKFCKERIRKLTSKVQIALKQKKMKGDVTVKDVLSSDFIANLVQDNIGFRVLQEDRSSPAYWQSKKKQVLAMIRQIGPGQIWMTLSAAESEWNELMKILYKIRYDRDLSDIEVSKLSYETKADLVRNDSQTCSEYFDHRVRETLKLLKEKNSIFKSYPVKDYFIRVEFQHRGKFQYVIFLVNIMLCFCFFNYIFLYFLGSPHAHVLLWLDGAPKYIPGNKKSEEEVVKFIDQFITCKKDPSIAHLLKYMHHKHTRSCKVKKNGKMVCRFGFPRLPMRQTSILHPLETEKEIEEKHIHSEKLKEIKQKTEEILKDKDVDLTFDEYLEKIGFNENDYILAIRSELMRPKIFLRRDICEAYINNYNKDLLLLHQANMDVQYILDVYACVIYLVDYMQKSDKGLSKLLYQLQADLKKKNSPVKDQLKAVVHLFVNKSETSNQEIDYHLLSLPLSMGSRKCQYINTSPKVERTRMLKGKEMLEFMAQFSPDSTEIFVLNVIDYYLDRPDSIKSICLADFVANYNLCKSTKKTIEVHVNADFEDDQDSNEDENTESLQESTSHGMKLKNKNLYMHKRKVPKIIRFRNYKESLDSFNYHREQLMLFTAWTDEDYISESVEIKYNENLAEIVSNRKKYFYMNEDIFDDCEELLNDSFVPVNSDDDVIPLSEIYRALAIHDPAEQDVQKDLSIHENYRSQDLTLYPIPCLKPSEKYLEDIYSLNDKQYQYLLNLMHHLKCHGDIQLLHFISGFAGTGKTKLISSISECVTRYYISKPGGSEDQIIVLKTAFMGRQAFHVEGFTLHSTFQLPLNQSGGKNTRRLDRQISHEITVRYRDVKVLIIDEISTVGQKHLLAPVEQRLRHIFNNDLLYGKLHMLYFGDLNQLSPVGDVWAFDNSTLSGIALWHKFKLYELTEIMRQKEDRTFAEALCRYAERKLTSEDVAMFQSRTVKELARRNIFPPQDALNLFCTNSDVDEYNRKTINNMTSDGCIVDCLDMCNSKNVKVREYCLDHVKSLTVVQTNGLRKSLNLKLGAKYMVSRNLVMADGLNNGVIGVLKHIMWGKTASGEKVPSKLFFLFEHERIGKQTRAKWSAYMKNNKIDLSLTPIERISDIIYTSKDNTTFVIRSMFPLGPAMGVTVHKSQGVTTDVIVFHPSKFATKRHWYVALSRVTSKEGLFIHGDFQIPSVEKSKTDEEMERMRRECPLKFTLQFPQEVCEEFNYFIFHNARSINKHQCILKTDKAFAKSACMMLVETWLLPSEELQFSDFCTIHRTDCRREHRTAFGMLLLVHTKSFPYISLFDTQTYDAKVSFLDVASYFYKDILVTFLHKSPKYPISNFVSYLEFIASKAKNCNVQFMIIIGDFNIDFLKASTEKNQIMNFMTKHKLILCQDYFPTTDYGSMIDLCFSNIPLFMVNVYESLTSDHKPLWFKL